MMPTPPLGLVGAEKGQKHTLLYLLFDAKSRKIIPLDFLVQ